MAPVTAQGMTTLRGALAESLRWDISVSFDSLGINLCSTLVLDQSCEALVAPEALVGDSFRRRRALPCSSGVLPVRIVPHSGGRQVRHVAAEPAHVAPA